MALQWFQASRKHRKWNHYNVNCFSFKICGIHCFLSSIKSYMTSTRPSTQWYDITFHKWGQQGILQVCTEELFPLKHIFFPKLHYYTYMYICQIMHQSWKIFKKNYLSFNVSYTYDQRDISKLCTKYKKLIKVRSCNFSEYWYSWNTYRLSVSNNAISRKFICVDE